MHRWGADAPHVPAAMHQHGFTPGANPIWWAPSGLDGARLKQYLLYWDYLDWPNHNRLSVSMNMYDLDMLEEQGVLRRSRVEIPEEEWRRHGPLRIGAIMQLECFERNNRIKGEEWAIDNPSSLIQLPPKSVIQSRTVEVELHKQLFAPSEEVPTVDVLQFREKWADELKAFRSAMYEFYEVLPAAVDLTRAQEQAVLQIERSVRDLREALEDTRWPLVPLRFQSKLDLIRDR